MSSCRNPGHDSGAATEARLLTHVFQHDGTWYFTDAVTNDVFECDEVVAAVLQAWPRLDEAATRAELDREWGPGRVAVALEEIRALRAGEGALAPQRLRIRLGCAICHDARAYDSRIEHLQMTVSEQCNLRCEYCPHTALRSYTRPHRDVYMSEATADAAIDFYLARSGDVEKPAVSFYGGEPLLRFDLIRRIVLRARAAPGGDRISFIVDTNGTLLRDDVAAFFAEQGVRMQFSLDGPRPIHDRYRRTRSGKGSYDAVIAGIERMLRRDRDSHQRMTFNATLAPPFDVEAVVAFYEDFAPFRKYGIDQPPLARIEFADLSGFSFRPRDVGEGSVVSASRARRGLHARYLETCRNGAHDELSPILRSLFDKGIIDYHHRPRTMLETTEVFPTGCCQPGQRKIHVKADGTLLPCERGSDHMRIGHVRSGVDLAAIERLYQKLIDAVEDRCPSCWNVRGCGVCFIHMASTWGEDGSGEVTVPEEVCESVRRAREGVLRDYLTLKKAGPQALAWLKNTTIQ